MAAKSTSRQLLRSVWRAFVIRLSQVPETNNPKVLTAVSRWGVIIAGAVFVAASLGYFPKMQLHGAPNVLQQSVRQKGVLPLGAPPGAVAYNPTTGQYLTPATTNRDGSPAPPVPSVAVVKADNAAGAANIEARETALNRRKAYKARVAQIENPSGDRTATSPTGATGPYQFLPSTWKQYGAGGDIHGDQEAAMDRFTDHNRASLTRAFGRAPTPGELYLSHQQGDVGAILLLQHPAARAGDLVGNKAVRVNGGDPNASAATFTNIWIKRFEQGGMGRVNALAR